MKDLLVYTMITSPDQLIYPPLAEDPAMDFVAVTQLQDLISPFWKVHYMKNLLEVGEKIKTSPEKYFPGYKAYRYVEPSAIIYGRLSQEPKAFMEVPELASLIPKYIPLREPQVREFLPNPVYTQGPYEGYPLQLSICLPISNRVKSLRKCLEGLKPLLTELDAELIVVDTSTDGSRAIAEAYGSKIIPFTWTGDFSALRNAAIQQAQGAWILSIDDDECFEDVEEVLSFFQSTDWKRYDIAFYVVRNYLNPKGTVYNDLSVQRMARNHPQLHYVRAVHETFDFSYIKHKQKIKYFSSFAHHFGYAYENEQDRKAKGYRNLASMYTALKEAPTDLRLLYQLANELAVLGDHEAASAYALQLISLAKLEAAKGTLQSNWETSALILLYLLSYESGKALYAEIAKALVNPDQLDCFAAGSIHHTLAMMAFENQEWDKGCEHGETYHKNRMAFLERPDRDVLSSRLTVNLVGPIPQANALYMNHTVALLKTERMEEAAAVFSRVDGRVRTDAELPLLAEIFCEFELAAFRRFCQEVDDKLLKAMYGYTKRRAVEQSEKLKKMEESEPLVTVELPGQLFKDLKEKLVDLVEPEEPYMQLIAMQIEPEKMEIYEGFVQQATFLGAHLEEIVPCAVKNGFEIYKFLPAWNLEQIQRALRSLSSLERTEWDSWVKGLVEEATIESIEDRSKKELYFLSALLEKGLFQDPPLWEKDSPEYKDGFLLYVRLLSCWSNYYYRAEMFQEDSFQLLPSTARAAFWVEKALAYKEKQLQDCLSAFKQAVVECITFESGVKLLLKELKEQPAQQLVPVSSSSEFEQLGQQLKATVKQLIGAGSFAQAQQILLQLQKLLPGDEEIQDLMKMCNE